MSSIPTAEAIRKRILSDHDRLLDLVCRLKAEASEARRDERAAARVRDSLIQLGAELGAHLAYEETVLVPLLTEVDTWGPLRAEHLLKDHVGQRAVLSALIDDAGPGGRSIDALSDELTSFVDTFVQDMRDEEATFLNTEAMGDELVVGDQVHG